MVSWEKMASNVNVCGAEVDERRWTVPVVGEAPPTADSQRVSCFLLLSTFRREVESEESEEIRIITRTWRQQHHHHCLDESVRRLGYVSNMRFRPNIGGEGSL